VFRGEKPHAIVLEFGGCNRECFAGDSVNPFDTTTSQFDTTIAMLVTFRIAALFVGAFLLYLGYGLFKLDTSKRRVNCKLRGERDASY
jgi:hypothetical protein